MDSGELLLVVAAGMLVVAAVAQTAAVGVVQLRTALAFGGFIAFGELLRLSLPGGREVAPIAMVGAMSYALLLTLPARVPARHHHFVVTHQSALLVVAVAAVGMAVG